MNKQRVFKRMLVLAALALLLGLVGCEMIEPQSGLPVPTAARSSQVSPLATAVPPSPVSPLATPTRPSPVPTDDDVAPTPAPTTTPPPFPTPLPTPVVTPIPTVAPPIIPLSPEPASKLYTLVFRDGNVIRAINSDGTSERVLVDIRADQPLFLAGAGVKVDSWEWGGPSPDGTQMALVLSNVEDWQSLPKGQKPEYGIYLFELSTRRLRLLVQNGVEPVWSPDGARIAYRSTQTSGLWIVDVATGKAREIYAVDQKNEHFAAEMDWSPDGKRLVFLDEVFRQSHTLMVVGAEGAGPATVLVPSTIYWPSFPKWSPDGGKILFTYNAGKSSSSQHFYNLWVINPDGTGQIQITKDIDVHRPRWSPDGRWIAFDGPIAYEEPEPEYELWLMDGTGSALKRLTSNTINKVSEAMPAWSPDGNCIFFIRGTSFTRGEYEVWTISLVNGAQTNLPSSVTSNFFVLR